MKRILLINLFLFTTIVFSQTLLIEENFNYTAGTLLTSNGWTAYSGSGTNSIVIETGGLSYSGYPSSGIGNSILVDNNGEDIYASLSSAQSSGSIYVSLLVNVSSATTAAGGDYFFGLGSNAAGTVAGRLFLLKSGSNFAFGISKTTGTTSFTGYDYSFNTTYLIVIKYIINSGSSNDDVALFVITGAIPDTEPAATISQPQESTSDPANIAVVALRQNSTTNIVQVDGIRVATGWSQAPLPVELTSFTSNVIGNKVELNWRTATEVNNYGFEVQRLAVSNQLLANSQELNANGWSKIGFVQGNGNSNSPKNYSFIDQPTGGKEFKYRLKQIDFDGSFEYSYEVTAKLGNVSTYKLDQNYPNPFNPYTKISYTIPQRAYVHLRVYDMLAKEVAELVNTIQESGRYEVTFDGTNLPSGAYFYKLDAGNYIEVKKLLLVK